MDCLHAFLIILFSFLKATTQSLPETAYQESACYGSLPLEYGYMSGSCSTNEIIAVQAVSVGTKTQASGCEREATTKDFNETDFSMCCLPTSDDCIFAYSSSTNPLQYQESCSGKTTCSTLPVANMLTPSTQCDITSTYWFTSTYMYMDFYCITDSKIGECSSMNLQNDGSGSALYIWNQGYPYTEMTSYSSCTCSIEVDCYATINVTAIDIRFENQSGICYHSITFDDSSSTKSFDCSTNNDFVIQHVYTSESSYITMNASNTFPNTSGYFWLAFQTSDNGNLKINCPATEQTQNCSDITTTDGTTSTETILVTTEVLTSSTETSTSIGITAEETTSQSVATTDSSSTSIGTSTTLAETTSEYITSTTSTDTTITTADIGTTSSDTSTTIADTSSTLSDITTAISDTTTTTAGETTSSYTSDDTTATTSTQSTTSFEDVTSENTDTTTLDTPVSNNGLTTSLFETTSSDTTMTISVSTWQSQTDSPPQEQTVPWWIAVLAVSLVVILGVAITVVWRIKKKKIMSNDKQTLNDEESQSSTERNTDIENGVNDGVMEYEVIGYNIINNTTNKENDSEGVINAMETLSAPILPIFLQQRAPERSNLNLLSDKACDNNPKWLNDKPTSLPPKLQPINDTVHSKTEEHNKKKKKKHKHHRKEKEKKVLTENIGENLSEDADRDEITFNTNGNTVFKSNKASELSFKIERSETSLHNLNDLDKKVDNNNSKNESIAIQTGYKGAEIITNVTSSNTPMSEALDTGAIMVQQDVINSRTDKIKERKKRKKRKKKKPDGEDNSDVNLKPISNRSLRAVPTYDPFLYIKDELPKSVLVSKIGLPRDLTEIDC